MFAAIASTVGKIFGTDKAAASLIDNISSGLDKLHYGDQEKAEDNAKAVTEGRVMVMDWLKNTQGQNLSRRVIALTVTAIWALNILLVQALSVISVWVSVETSVKCVDSAKIIAESGQTVTSAMMLVLAFYFAAPQMGKFADAALKKFGNT